MEAAPDILYEDNHLIIVNKPCGELVQGDSTGDPTLGDSVKEYLKTSYGKPGNVFLGVPHRLDRPVSGAVIYAKTSKALSRMAELFRKGEIDKIYWAVTTAPPAEPEGELRDYLYRNQGQNKSYTVDKSRKDAKEALLKYRFLGASKTFFLVEVLLLTGRHHQIRAQLSHAGCPIKGDLKYGAHRSNPDGGISLHARQLRFTHPVTGQTLIVTAPPPRDNVWDFFTAQYGQTSQFLLPN